ncbi:type IX secretion system membrane protein, PorP/SprF family [Reichenbachiella faecimaris]|uniref:Type IX secretion system membrane protein, PorP/SprF family n=1 Tax=Reichenbachiella faecimaris TaxID=692418 RepID=A0A1W2GK67_REIFA|nr:type IX secretion system membrane protein PorP/SprF [Reichenbachiella faecimaris]SMD36944.1 type IX secretion system membrane protein, PorP/SprF family [Reichenbachiella faecimaris]
MKIHFSLLFFMISCSLFAQQDPLYSQYQFNQLMINPAYAGMYNSLSAGAISRFQWAGIDGAPRTNTVIIQSGLLEGRMGVGGLVLNDQFGVSNNYEVQLAGSYNINFEHARLGMGIQGGYIQYGYDFSKVNFDYLDDPEILNGHETISKPNVGLGLMYMSERFFVGASVPRILNVSITDGMTTSERYKRHYYFTSGFVAEIDRTPVKLMTLVRSMNGEDVSVDITASVFLDAIVWAGLTVRDFKHFGAMAIFSLGDNLNVGYSFEMPSNSLVYGNYGTHEISLQFTFKTSPITLFQQKYF